MFANPALCHFRKTRSQCLSGRTENNYGTDSWFPNRHETQDVQNAVRSITILPLANHITICETQFLFYCLFRSIHTPHIYPLSRLTPNVSFFLQSLLQRQCTVSPAGQHVAGGLTQVILKECGQQIKASLRSGSAQLERHMSKLSDLWSHALFMNCLQIATLASSSSRLFLPLFVILTSCTLLF